MIELLLRVLQTKQVTAKKSVLIFGLFSLLKLFNTSLHWKITVRVLGVQMVNLAKCGRIAINVVNLRS